MDNNLNDVELVKQGDYYRYGKRSMLVGRSKLVDWKRGKISKFSKESRKRMMKFLARVKWDGALFITLTGREDVTYSQLVSMMKRYYRRWGKAPAVWRKEEQARGVYHYHILIFTRNWLPVNWLIKVWAEILGESGSVSVKYVTSRGGAWRYITKYMSKHNDDNQGIVDISAERERSDDVDGILDNTIISCHWPGRFWGYFQRHMFRYADIERVKLLDCDIKVISKYLYIVDYLRGQEWGYVIRGFSFVVI